MADEFHAGLCSTMGWWNTMRATPSFDFPQPPTISWSSTATVRDITNESPNWSTTTQPFLPAELNQIQAGFGDSSMMMNDQALLPGLFESIDPLKDMNDSWGSSPQLSRVPPPSMQQLNFANNTTFWNPSANNTNPSVPVKIPDESSSSNLITNKPSESKKNGSSDQPAAKKPRIATPSPLPTFKVRKEKLGDRITALQQLVSPFGKTDTASVLHEAVEYIKFLHGQVGALSTPYLKNGNQMQQHQKGYDNPSDEGRVQDLRSRGLCLVPISSTFAMASETPMDFWAPTFLGGYR